MYLIRLCIFVSIVYKNAKITNSYVYKNAKITKLLLLLKFLIIIRLSNNLFLIFNLIICSVVYSFFIKN